MDNATYKNILDVYRKIATRSSAIVSSTYWIRTLRQLLTKYHEVFLGCPHRTESIDELEDQLHGLLSTTPGPDISRGIVGKIKNLASQIDRINVEFLQTKMLSRCVILNVFYLPDIEELHTDIPMKSKGDEAKSGKAMSDLGNPLTEGITDRTSTAVQISTAPIISGSPVEGSPELHKGASSVSEISTPVSSPFSRYTVTMFNTFEFGGRYRQMEINHADLVRGDDGVDADDSWISYFAKEFNKSDMRA